MTREADRFDDLNAKAEFINNQNADLCVSIHCKDAGEDTRVNGTEIYFVGPEVINGIISENNFLAQSINGILKINFVNRGIKNQKQGIRILQASQCPAIIIEAGYLSNKNDAAMLQKTDKQELIANSILKGVENYLALKEWR